jgi:hypothetical protein
MSAISQIVSKATMKPAVTAKNAIDANTKIRSLMIHPVSLLFVGRARSESLWLDQGIGQIKEETERRQRS